MKCPFKLLFTDTETEKSSNKTSRWSFNCSKGFSFNLFVCLVMISARSTRRKHNRKITTSRCDEPINPTHTLLAVRVHCKNLSEAHVYVSSLNTVSNWSTTETMRKKLLKSTNNKYTFCYVHKVSHTYLKYDNILDMNETLFIVFHHSVIIRDPPKLEY